MVKVDGIYRHYKNKNHLYKVIAIAKHSETLEDLVVYQALYESEDFPMFQVWVRPLKMFEETINGKLRFEEVDQNY